MKPIGAAFGFWLLLAMGFFNAVGGDGQAAAIFMVGAVLFNAIKALDR